MPEFTRILHMKYILSIIVVAGVAGGIWYVSSRGGVQQEVTPTPSVSAVVSAEVSAAPSVVPTAAGATFTAAQVAAHSTVGDCYSIIRGSVYNLTSYVPKHPGGVQKILPICGKDGTTLFVGQHGGSEKQESMLATLKIGELAQ